MQLLSSSSATHRQLVTTSTSSTRRRPLCATSRRPQHARTTAASSLAVDAQPCSEQHLEQTAAAQLEAPHGTSSSSTNNAAQQHAAKTLPSPAATGDQLHGLLSARVLLALLGVAMAAVVAVLACRAVLAAPGALLLCLLGAGATTLAAFFWRRPTHRPAAAQAAPLSPLTEVPAEAHAWLSSAQQGLWAALWHPLLQHREDLEASMSQHGPIAWAYDVSDVSVGSLAPSFTAVQAFVHPSTGALAAVEADLLLDTNGSNSSSVSVSVVARGPIGRYTISLQRARVQGRVRLVPVQGKEEQGRLLQLSYVGSTAAAPSADVALDTAYPSLLPHDRTKLAQVDAIEAMLQATLQGLLAPTDVRLKYAPQLPATLQHAAEGFIRGIGMAAAAALQGRAVAASPAATDVSGHSSSSSSSSGGLSPATHSLSAPAADSTAAAQTGSLSTTAAAPTARQRNNNSTVSQSAALLLAAQKAAWRQQQQLASDQQGTSAAAAEVTANKAVGGRDQQGSRSKGASSSSYQLRSTVAAEMECWAATGLTAKLWARAAAATAGPKRSSVADGLTASSSTASAALSHAPGLHALRFSPAQPAALSGSAGSSEDAGYLRAPCVLPAPIAYPPAFESRYSRASAAAAGVGVAPRGSPREEEAPVKQPAASAARR